MNNKRNKKPINKIILNKKKTKNKQKRANKKKTNDV